MNIGEVCKWVDLSRSTVRKYLNDFGDIDGLFSQSALPATGKHRRFTNKDVAVISWISRQYSQYNLITEDVRAALIEYVESGQPFEEPPRPDSQRALTAIPREQHEAIIAANERALELARAERDALERMLQGEREAFKQERSEMRTAWQTEISQLNRRIGRLEEKILQLGGDPNID
jgi:DNA-binding transcriptional MerR regulator